jgi:predicted aconitase
LELTELDKELAAGQHGPAAAFAMDVLVRFAEAVGAKQLLGITQAHIDGCLYHGRVSLDFIDRLVQDGGCVRVPSTLNVGSMDLLHPELIRSDPEQQSSGKRLMEAHLQLGCEPTFTCAPYQTRFRPRFGEQIAWGESNAIVFANSVIGARTNRYGDFIDLCCAMTGRAPAFGLHLDEGRLGQVLFRLQGFPDSLEPTETLFVAVGYIVGERSGQRVPVIDGLPKARSEDQLKALGAVAASSGSVALFHAIGVTPEAPSLSDAFGGKQPEQVIEITAADIKYALSRLSTACAGTPIVAVSLGTPHFSIEEFRRLEPLLAGIRLAPGVEVYINTSRETYGQIEKDGLLSRLQHVGIRVVTDTCTYVTSIIRNLNGVIMTNSGKWAHYAPANLGVKVAFGNTEDCLRSAAEGVVVNTTV